MTTALVTGVGGQDGVLAARRLVSEGVRVVGTVRPGWDSPLRTYLDGVEIVECDVRDAATTDRLIADTRPDEVFHLAAFSSVAGSFDQASMVRDVNDLATAALLSSLRRHAGDARVCLASSAEVFGPEPGVRSETTLLDPRSPYAESKARLHEYAQEARDEGQFVAVGVLFNHESPIRAPRFVTRKITRAAAAIAAGSTTKLTLGNLQVTRDWGAAVDTVDALVRLVRAPEARDVVVATGQLHTMGDLVEAAFAAAEVDDPWSFVEQDPELMRSADTPGAVADTSVANQWLGWNPTQSFTELIAKMVAADQARVRTGVEEDVAYLG